MAKDKGLEYNDEYYEKLASKAVRNSMKNKRNSNKTTKFNAEKKNNQEGGDFFARLSEVNQELQQLREAIDAGEVVDPKRISFLKRKKASMESMRKKRFG